MTGGSRSSRFLDWLLSIGAALSGAILVGIMLIVCLKVFLRYVVGYGWIGVDQMTGLMLLYLTFLGAAWVLSREEHVTIDILLGALPRPVQRGLIVANSLLCAAVCLLVFVYAVLEVSYSWSKGIMVASEIEIPRVASLAVIPVGLLFLWIQFLRRAWATFHNRPPGEFER